MSTAAPPQVFLHASHARDHESSAHNVEVSTTEADMYAAEGERAIGCPVAPKRPLIGCPP